MYKHLKTKLVLVDNECCTFTKMKKTLKDLNKPILEGVTELKNQLNEEDEIFKKLSWQLKVKLPETHSQFTPTNLLQRIGNETNAIDLKLLSEKYPMKNQIPMV